MATHPASVHSNGDSSESGPGGLTGVFVLSYAIGALLLYALAQWAGPWYILANTRILDLMIKGGIVRLHDGGNGVIDGVPALTYWVKSQDPINGQLIFVAALIFVLFWGIKAVQFHGIARVCGIQGSVGAHARAYLYGNGINRLLPFNVGNAATVSALAGQGAPLDRGAVAIYLGELFVVFEIVVYAIFGLFLLDWTTWLTMMFWSLIILGVLCLFMRQTRGQAPPSGELGGWRATMAVLRTLARQPRQLVVLGLLSLLAFGLEDVAAYFIAQAFTGTHVILHVDTTHILMGVIGSYVARLVPLTPGGIGQFEWGFATALYIGGLGAPEAATIAILDNALRYTTGFVVLAVVTLVYGIETNLRRALDLFRGIGEPLEAGAA
jgi:glycosyltransferase AglD